MNSFATRASASRRRLRLAVAATALFVATAYASSPPNPAPNLQAAQQAIASAEREEAGTHAFVELSEAREKLSSAQQALNGKKLVEAAQLADEARAEAELAAARSGAAKAQAVNEDMKRSTATLIEEMQRKTGEQR
ncbi:MAG TPA: DUF4398 domain-containing protein [Steroidobacteraceae bacterium]|jgi:Domain of unknown function (DUF4398)|nr:DUF4398 domain-containing protein [Steroidobacteraceae bacterium]